MGIGEEINRLANLGVPLLDFKDNGVMVPKVVRLSFGVKIKEKQVLDPVLMKIKRYVGVEKVMAFEINGDGTLWYQRRLCARNVE